jgi:hypothetical protein
MGMPSLQVTDAHLREIICPVAALLDVLANPTAYFGPALLHVCPQLYFPQ